MSSPSPGKRRMDTDVVKLIESKHEVTILGGLNEFVVKFYGPQGTPYEGGVWKVRVDLPDKYPFKSPSIESPSLRFHIIREKGRNRKDDPLLSLDLLNTHRISSEVPVTQGIESELLAGFLTQEETGPGPSLLSRKGSALGRGLCLGVGCHGLGLAVRGFMNKIFHPNIDEASGTVYLTNIFESFLPQLLAYPNPIDPLNGDAAAMYLHRPEEYKQKIKEYIQKYATEEALKEQEEGTGDSSSESSMSDFSEDEAQDMEL
ncbi:ubiquitin-conjugating enzyme E2 H isoform X6 [Prionailurus iriomotensis]